MLNRAGGRQHSQKVVESVSSLAWKHGVAPTTSSPPQGRTVKMPFTVSRVLRLGRACLSVRHCAAMRCPSWGSTALCRPAAAYGNAPSRVRPRELPEERIFRQHQRETSATLVIVLMAIGPLWMLLLWHQEKAAEREEQLRRSGVFAEVTDVTRGGWGRWWDNSYSFDWRK